MHNSRNDFILIMGKRKPLSDNEQGQIQAFLALGMPKSTIARELSRSRSVIAAYKKKGSLYGTTPHNGRPRAISPRTTKAIIKLAKNKSITARQIIAELGLEVSESTVRRVLKNEGGLTQRKLQRKPVLTDENKRNRVEFAKEYMELGNNWKRVIFLDEKKFNLDGPDGYAYYWHALGGSHPNLSRRAFGGGSIIVWACFDYSGRSDLVFKEGGIDSTKYPKVLEKNLLPFLATREHPYTLFQQDNARPHTS
ncbi:hypothetical protein ENBRE01_3071 [Enteropsectra breve]|nr:hypothetical protein ENBRE01_3071 [Enteropsectra breve]